MICRFSADELRREFTPLDNSFIADYLPDADALQLKVYIYGYMQCCHPSVDAPLTDALGISEEEALQAFVYWQNLGLVRILGDRPLSVEYRTGALFASSGPAKYTALVRQLNTLTAPRQFGMHELRHVYDWIEVYGLDEGAVLELVSYCMEKRGRRISVNYMSSVAQSWAEEGILTVEAARKEIDAFKLKRHGATAILKHWNKRRRPTVDEMTLYEKWTGEWGFSDEAILAALPRLTVSGSPNFTYLDELLFSMKEGKLTDAASIAADNENTEKEREFFRQLYERAGSADIPSATSIAQLSVYLHDYAMPREVLFYAADCSKGASSPIGSMKLLLNQWNSNGIRTVADAEAFRKTHPAPVKKTRRGMGAGASYSQHPVSEMDFSSLFVDLDSDLPED